jgi:NADPH-dependent 2,4-dienoyl-CoA reductase/sulfur reductase-like enzyme/rhodanese-related sulfurtransferase
MSNHHRIVVIGGTACGTKAAARARRCDPSARITIIEQKENLSTSTCGLPYYVANVIKKESDLVARPNDYFRDVMDMEVLAGTRALAVHPKAHTVEILNQKTERRSAIEYDKLVIATGAAPISPDWEGRNLAGIFTLSGIPDAAAIRSYLETFKPGEAVIVGAGLIGLEMAEAFTARGLKVTVLEALDWPLPSLLDAEIAARVEKHLRFKGVTVRCGRRVTGFLGDRDRRVRKVVCGDAVFEAGIVLLSLGVRPNVALAKDAGLTIGVTGGLSVNECLQTGDPDIYAGGDCVEVVNIVTAQKTFVPLGSTANKHGRIIGTNVTGGSDTFPGVVGTSIAKVFDFNVARTGLNEAQARDDRFDIVTSLVPAPEHAEYYPGARDITVKLIADKTTGRLLGGQAVGPGETAKRIDVLATAITFGATVDNLANLDLAYAPPYNSALDPLHHAANVIRNKLAGYARTLTPAEVKKKLDDKEDFILLDVRSPQEWKSERIEARQTKLLHVDELRRRLDELSLGDEIVAYCHTSIRAYQAQRILDGAGFKDVKFMDGSLAAWPYEISTDRK